MAGDIPIPESVVLLDSDIHAAPSAGEDLGRAIGGRILHRFGPRVLIAAGAATDENAVETVPGGRHRAAMAVDTASDLDPVGRLGLAALALRQSEEYAERKANRPLAGSEWDDPAGAPPDAEPVVAPEPPEVAEAPQAEAEAPAAPPVIPSGRMVGDIAVGLIIVEGPTPELQFSDAEQTQIVAEVQNGLTWLAAQNPSAAITWTYDIHVVSITTAPNPGASDLEALWRDPAMAQLGYSADWSGVETYVRDLRRNLQTEWSYCGFFTRYPVGHFGYANIWGPRIVMQWPIDGWGPDNIDRVFAHETGHIFGAPDEYASSGCGCGGNWGFFQTSNTNCINCAPGGGVGCIMRSNEWAMCSHTRTHIGWESTMTAQTNWRWCKKCHGLAFGGGSQPGACPAGGQHDHVDSGNYTLLHNLTTPAVQANWRWCKKCQSMAFGGGAGPRPCPAGGTHDHTGSGNYTLLHNVGGSVGQGNWRWCKKCQALAYGGTVPSGPCPAGGLHDHVGSGNYTLLHETSNPSGQSNWRWCRKCQNLVFGGGSASPCAGGGQHDLSQSGNYTALHNLTTPSQQGNWRWCRKCQGLAYGGSVPPGPCPAGGTHDHVGSGNYTLLHNTRMPQEDWRWCRRCQGLVFGAGAGAPCPSPTGTHDLSGSGNYSLLHM